MSRNEEIRRILKSREIAAEQNKRCKRGAKRKLNTESFYVRSSLWPRSKRIDK